MKSQQFSHQQTYDDRKGGITINSNNNSNPNFNCNSSQWVPQGYHLSSARYPHTLHAAQCVDFEKDATPYPHHYTDLQVCF
jgi:SET domain-containing protein